MYSATRSLLPNLPTVSVPPFQRRSYQRTHSTSRTAPTPHPTSPAADANVSPRRITRIFGYSVPAFVLVVTITLLCAVVPRLVMPRIALPVPTSHLPFPSQTADNWMSSLNRH